MKNISDALIGYSGFVGGSLLQQRQFEYLYRSVNINQIVNNKFDLVVCCGVSAVKWLANKDPEQDWINIKKLIDNLNQIHCNKFILISTVDVFSTPNQVNENTQVNESGLHAYGLHRRELEKFVENRFSDHLIVRLPGLVGPGLKKNIIFDFANNHNLEAIDSRSLFQFYPMGNLWTDIEIAIKNNLKLIHLTSEPISVSNVAENGFNRKFLNVILDNPPTYDFRTIHAKLFGKIEPYQYSKKETLLAIRSYFQSETLGVK